MIFGADTPLVHADKEINKIPVENPPAYSSSSYPLHDTSTLRASHATNHLSFKSRKDPIAGLFQIDPLMDVHNPSLEKMRRGRRKKSKGRADPSPPNATFETRQGDIALSLAAVAGSRTGYTGAQRVVVDVSSRQGNVDIAVFQIDSERHICLNVESRQGNVHVLVPRSFRGPVHLRTKKGAVSVLPRISSAVQVIDQRPQETLLMVGSGVAPPMKDWQGDFLNLYSRSGNVIVGYYGEDEIPKAPGFWSRLSALFMST